MRRVENKTVLLLRHGSTGTAIPSRFLGSTDLPLSAAGRRQAAAVAPLVCSRNPQVCLCSPMLRCVQTAEIVRKNATMKLDFVSGLREVDFGRWENLSFEEIQKSDPERLDRWAAFDRQFSFPGGECLGDFLARVRRVARQIVSAPHQTILVVTHGGVIRALLCHFLGLHPRRYVLFDVRPASLAVIDVFATGKGVLAGLVPCSRKPKVDPWPA
jgi:alpha-ribazole phosphatase